MDLFKLVATLGLDSTGFTTGLVSAQDMFSSFASAVVGFTRDVMNTGLNFDSAMSSVQAVLGSQEGTVENMNRLRAFALEQASDSIFTAEQTAQAYYYMGMAGWKSEQMIKGLPGVMALAAASGEDLAMVSDIVTDSITAFGLSADDVQHYVDVLAMTATNTNTTVGLMGETFKYVAPIAGSLGADVDDVAVSIGLMASAGIKGSMAGTALRQMFTRIATNAGASSKALGAMDIITQQLGVSFWDAKGKMRDWGDVIADVRLKWRDLSQEEQVAYAKQIASERGMAGWMALMNASEEDVRQLTEAIGEASGAAQDMSDTRQDNLAGDITRFNSALNIMKIAIYDDVKGPMREVVQWGTDAINEITDAINEKGLAGGIEVMGAKIEEAGEKFAPLLESIGKAAGPLIESLFENVLPRLFEAGEQLAAGLLKGLGDGLASSDNPLSGIIGTLLGGAGYTLDGIVDLSNLLGIFNPFKKTQEEDIPDYMLPPEMRDYDDAASHYSIALDYTMVPDAGAGIESEIESAGQAGGAAAADAVQNEINNRDYTIEVTPVLSGLLGLFGGGGVDKHAKSMSGGTILQGATVFGMNKNNQPMVGGEAGPEAVVGTGSLDRMIQDSVNGAMNEVLNRLDTMVNHVANYAPKIYLDTGALVGGTVNGMNSELNNVARWKGYGRV